MPPPEQMIAEYPLMAQRIAALEAQLAWFKKQVFGGKSEKLDPAQRQLPLSGVEQARSAVVERTEKIAYERTKCRQPRPTPAEAFAHIPVTETVEIVPEEVKKDPGLYEKIGEERTFELEIIGPRLVKREMCGRSSGTAWIAAARPCWRPLSPGWCPVGTLRPV